MARSDTHLEIKSLYLRIRNQHTISGTYTQIRIHLVFCPKGLKGKAPKENGWFNISVATRHKNLRDNNFLPTFESLRASLFLRVDYLLPTF